MSARAKDEEREKLLSVDGEGDNPVTEQIAALQEELASTRKGRAQERFLFALAVVVLLDLILFRNFDNWGACVVIGVLELFLGLALADHLGLKNITEICSNIFNIFSRNY